jgi:hypothetical protein
MLSTRKPIEGSLSIADKRMVRIDASFSRLALLGILQRNLFSFELLFRKWCATELKP